MIKTMDSRLNVTMAALIFAATAAALTAQSNANPHVDVRFAEDRTVANNHLSYWPPAQFPEGTMVGSVGIELSATAAAAARTWVIVIGRAHLEMDAARAADPLYIDAFERLKEEHPWLQPIEDTTVGDLFAAGGALSGIASRFLPSDLAALEDTEIKVTPGPLAAILDSATSTHDGMRAWGQPFRPNQLGADGKYRFVWRCFNDFWANPGWAPGGQSNWYWSSTFSRVREGDFANGKHLLSINRIAETLITYQGSAESGDPMAGYNFLNSSDYRLALSVGLIVTMQVISVRGSQYDPNNGWGNNPLITPGTFPMSGSLLGLSISEPLVINPVLNRPPFNSGPLPPPGTEVTYAVSPSSAFGLTAGLPAIVAVGQSAKYTHARFTTVGGGKVDAPLTYLYSVSGLATLVVPTNAITGNVEWFSAVQLPEWATIAMPSAWTTVGGIMEGSDAVAPIQ